MPSTLSTTLLTLLTLPSAHAWGTLGHTTIALIAQNFLHPKAVAYTQALLNDSTPTYLANHATWADSYRSTAEGAFTSVFHYIDALDAPPASCEVIYERDCPEEGCIVSALANYTARIRDEELSWDDRNKALKMVIHFTGDIHQPLHTENTAVGGNRINTTFDGRLGNLHRVWDSSIIEKLVGGFNMSFAQAWAFNLTTEIRHGEYRRQRRGWLKGMELEEPVGTAMVWANDANDDVCTTVLPEGVEGVEGKELGGAYYQAAIPAAKSEVAKAGYRLAAWLNLIATGKAGLPKGLKVHKRSPQPANVLPGQSFEWTAAVLEKRLAVRAARAEAELCGHEC
ncbi:hypothetical protein H2201_005381 [Coniosporium apollinis]|uniref:Nuclease S1 n=1 Tax=Coniosporium apollinis TaxID=61459 RepID=A0ABQ9NWF2_9PEZI|nr:hypothetical protein H2201_005381 [Coniosporium apollinis]